MPKRSKRILIATVLAGGVIAAAYALAPALLALLVRNYAAGFIDVQRLEIESVGPERTRIGLLDLQQGQIRFEAREATVRYRLWPFEIQGIDIDVARLSLGDVFSGSGSDGTALVLPPFPLNVEALRADMHTPWGESVILASVNTGPGPAAGVRGRIESPDFSIDLANPRRDRHSLTLRDEKARTLLSVDARTGADGIGLDGSLDPGGVSGWLRRSDAVPAGLRRGLSPYQVAGDALSFEGTIAAGGDTRITLTGAMSLADTRDPAERLFETIELGSDAGYRVARNGSGWSGSGEAVLRVVREALDVSGSNPAWTWSDESWAAVAMDIRLQQPALSAESIEIRAGVPPEDGARGDFFVTGLRPAAWPAEWAPYNITGDWAWQSSAGIEARGDARGDSLPALGWSAVIRENSGRVGLDTSTPIADLKSSLKVYTNAVARELNIRQGDLEGSLDITWDGDDQLTGLSVKTSPLDADLDEMKIRGMELSVSNRDNTLEALTLKITAPALELAAGAVAEDFLLELHLSLPEISVRSASTRLFDGAVSIRPVTIDLDRDAFTLFADIEALSLARIMALLELDNTELTGNVSGPVRVVYSRKRGLEINQGSLHNTEPGLLRFTLSGGVGEQGNIALRALENFEYEELDASVLYRPDGEYRIEARIVGKNPEVLQGHPIALNPTIEGRLPALFKAFFITGDFSRAIIKRLQEEQFTSTPGETPTFHDD